MYVYKNRPFSFYSSVQPLCSDEQLVLAAIPLNSFLNCGYREQLFEGDALPFQQNLRVIQKRRGKSEVLENVSFPLTIEQSRFSLSEAGISTSVLSRSCLLQRSHFPHVGCVYKSVWMEQNHARSVTSVSTRFIFPSSP